MEVLQRIGMLLKGEEQAPASRAVERGVECGSAHTSQQANMSLEEQ